MFLKSNIKIRKRNCYSTKSLVDNPGVGEGDIVAFTRNPLSEKSLNELIPALQARGVAVTW